MLAVCAQCHRANRRINRDIRPREFRRRGDEQVRLASLNFNSTLGIENAREVINGFVEELNRSLTRKNRLNKDFVTKSSLVLLNLPVAYRVSSLTKETSSRINKAIPRCCVGDRCTVSKKAPGNMVPLGYVR